MKLKSLDGVIVTHILRTGAAEKAGIQKDDVITKIADWKITGKGSFEEALSYFYPGDKVTIEYMRNGNLKTSQLTLQNLEGGEGVIKREFFTSALLGAKLEAVNTIERDRLKIPYGVKITSMTRGYLRDLGFRDGFVITHINQIPAKDPKAAGKYLEEFSGKLRLEGVAPNGQPFMQSYNVR